MSSSLYEIDFVDWSERQAALLRRRQARRRFVPSMRQKIDLASLYADAVAAMPETVDSQPPLPVSSTCEMTLDELLGERPTHDGV